VRTQVHEYIIYRKNLKKFDALNILDNVFFDIGDNNGDIVESQKRKKASKT